jgi:hypothetical protein
MSAAGFEPDGRRCNSCREHHSKSNQPLETHHLKPDPIEQEEKQIRAIRRELRKLQRRINNPPSVRLEQPIQRGWVRRYVLTEKARYRPDHETLKAILGDIGTEKQCSRPDFLKRRGRSRKLFEIDQPLKEIGTWEWSSRSHPRPEEWKKYFYRQSRYLYRQLVWLWIFSDPQLFELKVEPFWLTHLKLIEPLVIEREAELTAWMMHRNGFARYENLKGKLVQWRPVDSWRHRHELEKQEQTELRHFLVQHEEAETKSRAWWFRFSLFLFPHVAQRRGTPLRTERLQVQVLPWGPSFAPVAQPAEAADLRSV